MATALGYAGVGPMMRANFLGGKGMRLKQPWRSGLTAVVLGRLVGVIAVAAAGAQFLPVLGVREGGQRFTVIPRIDGYITYLTVLNARDGGINGVLLVWEVC
jgi:branched-chain amino acid transport system substrate-binding protein